MAKNTMGLWYDREAEAAARFYAQTFPDSTVGAVHLAPSDFPGGKEGDVLTVEFTVCGVPCVGLNGGDIFKPSEAFSFQIATEDQEETDRYWNAIVGSGGVESACGWCKDKWGLSWQITPRVLTEAMAGDGEAAKRAFAAMMKMRKSTSPPSMRLCMPKLSRSFPGGNPEREPPRTAVSSPILVDAEERTKLCIFASYP